MKTITKIIMIGLLSLLFISCGSGSANSTVIDNNIVDENTSTIPTDNDLIDTNTSIPPSEDNTIDVNISNIIHNGTAYSTVTSPFTGKVWLDRNLGAARVCESFDDEACFGDYYQWGRNFDGHEDRGSEVTNITAIKIDDAGSQNFIIGSATDWVSIDKIGTKRATLWSKADASSICPIDFRVPTINELKAETLDANVNNSVDAFTSFLKLPSSGGRIGIIGTLIEEGSVGYIWSSSINISNAEVLNFKSGLMELNSTRRANGLSVRCIKDNPEISVVHNGTSYGFVTSPFTGKVWLDKNLGASRVCETFDDKGCFGDYYQWGRNFDGHQNIKSEVSSVQATSIENVGFSLINGFDDWTLEDSRGSERSANWSKNDATSVCPIGFRVPKISELSAELLDDGSAEIQLDKGEKKGNSDDRRLNAFNSFLKLPSSGRRNIDAGQVGILWTTTVSEEFDLAIVKLFFIKVNSEEDSSSPENDEVVRCIKN